MMSDIGPNCHYFAYERALNTPLEQICFTKRKIVALSRDMSIAIEKKNNFAWGFTKWSPIQVLTPSDGG